MIHQLGGGISQAIGTGGRDLSADVEGRMTKLAITALAEDPRTRVIVVVSKAPSESVIPSILASLQQSGKPCIVQFVGWDSEQATSSAAESRVQFASTLAQAAHMAVRGAGLQKPLEIANPCESKTVPHIKGHLVGLFCGGTLCQEAWSILSQAGLDVVSNVAFSLDKKVNPEQGAPGHAVWDLGDDLFTLGKPHPMIEPSLRDAKVAAAGEDASIGLVLVDCVLGYGAHADPATSLAAAAQSAFRSASAQGRPFAVLASVTGTDKDPQLRSHQVSILESAGVYVAASNEQAVRIAIRMLQGAGS